jgi:hypothetical protein
MQRGAHDGHLVRFRVDIGQEIVLGAAGAV